MANIAIFSGGSFFNRFPLFLPSPVRGIVKVKEKIPPPGRGRDRVGVENGFFQIIFGERGRELK
jgi:hypothetical protein